MAIYQEVIIKLRNTQLKKLKSAAKNKTGTTLRLNKKNVEDEELPWIIKKYLCWQYVNRHKI